MALILCAIVMFEMSYYIDISFKPEWLSIPGYFTAGVFFGSTVGGQTLIDNTTAIFGQVTPLVVLSSKLSMSFALLLSMLALGGGLLFDRKVAKRDGQAPQYEKTTGLFYVLSGMLIIGLPFSVWYLSFYGWLFDQTGMTAVLKTFNANPTAFWCVIAWYLFVIARNTQKRRRGRRREHRAATPY